MTWTSNNQTLALQKEISRTVLAFGVEIALPLGSQRECCPMTGGKDFGPHFHVMVMSWGLQVAQQQKNEPADAEEKQLAPVWDNSVGWGSFVAISTNIRYQAVGAFEERVLVRLPLTKSFCALPHGLVIR